jgi:hypothetical protein
MEVAPIQVNSKHIAGTNHQEPTTMKITLLVLFILFTGLWTGSAFGQTGVSVLSNQPQVIESPSHPQHAEIHAMATETPLLGGSAYTYAQGERPLWEFGPVSEPTPLGDVARAFRKEKQTAKKAEVVLEKQGS